MDGLTGRLTERIRREGPLRFDLFQEMALYDADGGFYERPGRVGRGGDFVTAATWHPAFARCLARVARQVRDALGEPIHVVDVGAGEGELLGAIGEALRGGGGTGDEFHLVGVERSATRRTRAREKAPSAAWLSSLEEIPRFSGLLVAYELFDALPVRALLFAGEELVERAVGLSADGGFRWVELRCADSADLLERLRARGVVLRPGQLLEIRPAARSLARSLSEKISRGLLLVFDYGASARSLYGPARSFGTLEAFQAHRVTRDVLTDPGSRDITAWVDFTEIGAAFREAGLAVPDLVSQSRFLSAAGIAEEIAAAEELPSESDRLVERHALGGLVAPGGMGESIRVLVASRDPELAGRWVHWPERGIVPSNH
ncbi:MAG TPA: SAM-dependent methyltransferase [Thermoanaerobaculia bacterium]|nr:SAM-dependent methyltransferase [Thermoanaerobaculia bacterium]